MPELPGPVVIGLDVSGSMGSPVTGRRGRGATSKMRCVDVAALFAAAILRRNPDSVVIPFDTAAYEAKIDPERVDPEPGRAAGEVRRRRHQLLAAAGGRPTARWRDRRFAGCVLVSDMESWVGAGRHGSTAVMTRVAGVRAQPGAAARPRSYAGPKLVCIDLQPYATTQAPERADILNVGGFSDAVFSVVASFLGDQPERFVGEVEAIEL